MWVKVSLKVMILAGGLTSMSSSFITSFMIDAQNNEISFKLVSSVYLCTLDWNLCPTPPGMVRTWPVISLKLFWGRWVWDLPLCFDSHFLVNTSRCSSQYLSVISSKHCLCLQLEPRHTGTLLRPTKLNFTPPQSQNGRIYDTPAECGGRESHKTLLFWASWVHVVCGEYAVTGMSYGTS